MNRRDYFFTTIGYYVDHSSDSTEELVKMQKESGSWLPDVLFELACRADKFDEIWVAGEDIDEIGQALDDIYDLI